MMILCVCAILLVKSKNFYLTMLSLAFCINLYYNRVVKSHFGAGATIY